MRGPGSLSPGHSLHPNLSPGSLSLDLSPRPKLNHNLKLIRMKKILKSIRMIGDNLNLNLNFKRRILLGNKNNRY